MASQADLGAKGTKAEEGKDIEKGSADDVERSAGAGGCAAESGEAGVGEQVVRTFSRISAHMDAAEMVQLQTLHRNEIQEKGVASHMGDKDASLETRMTVDLGSGPEEVIMIDWLPNDPGHPFNWHPAKKFTQVVVTNFILFLTAVNATSVGIMGTWGIDWFRTTYVGYELSLTMYLFSLAITPLVLAPLSELIGRNLIYQVTTIISTLLFIPQATSRNLSGLLAARWFQGMTSAVGNSMVGGTIADLYQAKDRGSKMNFFGLLTFWGQATGGAIAGWIGEKAGIQWCYGVQGIAGGFSIVLNLIFLRETRADVLLSRRAKRLTKKTGIRHICAEDLEEKDIRGMFFLSLLRPLQYLFTEPIVTALSLWVGFIWACVFLGTSSTILVFRQYGWSPGLLGMTLLTTGIGGTLGYFCNFHQEYLYARARKRSPTGRAAPEVRLYWGAVGAIIFPVALYVFAWTGQPQFHWAIPAVFLTIAYVGVFGMYSAIYNYFADAYEIYSSSAQAAHSFVRNTFAATFPLFAKTMYEDLGYPVASTVVASIALVLGAAPILLIFFGARLRARSKVASALAQRSF